MRPSELRSEQFNRYPPQARKLSTENLRVLRILPLSFLPNLLREIIDYDFKFPAERKALEKELANLNSLSAEQVGEWFGGFAQISLSSQLEHSDWVDSPAQFVEQLSAFLWSTHQIDAFRAAATEYGERLQTAIAPEKPAIPRLGITVIGQGVATYDEPLFRKLRPHGVYFSRLTPENGLKLLLDGLAARVKAHPLAYGHWYIDGGQAVPHDVALTCVSYGALEPMRASLLRKIQQETEKPGMGPEALRSQLAHMRSEDFGMSTEPEASTTWAFGPSVCLMVAWTV